jgi:hypothetical protein
MKTLRLLFLLLGVMTARAASDVTLYTGDVSTNTLSTNSFAIIDWSNGDGLGRITRMTPASMLTNLHAIGIASTNLVESVSNIVASLAIANDTTTSNALRSAFVANDTATSNALYSLIGSSTSGTNFHHIRVTNDIYAGGSVLIPTMDADSVVITDSNKRLTTGPTTAAALALIANLSADAETRLDNLDGSTNALHLKTNFVNLNASEGITSRTVTATSLRSVGFTNTGSAFALPGLGGSGSHLTIDGNGTVTKTTISGTASTNVPYFSADYLAAGTVNVTNSVTVFGSAANGVVRLDGTNTVQRLGITLAPDGSGTNELRLNLASPAAGHVFTVQSVTGFGPTNQSVITNIAPPWQTTNAVLTGLAANAATTVTNVGGAPLSVSSGVLSLDTNNAVWLTRYTNYAQASLTVNAATHVTAAITNAVAGNINITFDTPVIGTSFSISGISDGSARTITPLCESVTLKPMSTNWMSSGTNWLTVASKDFLLCGRFSRGVNGVTNLHYWAQVAP